MNKAVKTSHITVGDQPVVVLPLVEYERMQEDLEMLRSGELRAKVTEARKQFVQEQVITSSELQKALGLI